MTDENPFRRYLLNGFEIDESQLFLTIDQLMKGEFRVVEACTGRHVLSQKDNNLEIGNCPILFKMECVLEGKPFVIYIIHGRSIMRWGTKEAFSKGRTRGVMKNDAEGTCELYLPPDLEWC